MGTVIFDLDGTLADTAADLLAAANACFRALGHGDVLRLETDRGVALRGGRSMFLRGFERLGIAPDEALLASQYPVLIRHYGQAIDVHTRLYPGVEAALDRLRGAGYALGICTNKPAALAETLVTRLGARPWFAALLGADSLAVKKPDPAHLRETVRLCGGDPRRCLLVGDTETDHSTARNAGVPSVLVDFGDGETDVAALAPDAVLRHYDDLPDLVARLLGPA